MSWKKSENSNNVKPAEIDKISSRKVVFIRKNFEEVPTYDEEGVQIDTHWEYLENNIPKSEWETYEQIMSNTMNIADLEDAICELSI